MFRTPVRLRSYNRLRAEKREEKLSGTTSGTDLVGARHFESVAREAAATTDAASRLERYGYRHIPESRGLSTALYLQPDGAHKAFNGEGLGTKNLVIEAIAAYESGPWASPYEFYYQVAQCCVAMITLDLNSLGALPMGMAQILNIGGKVWYNNPTRYQALLDGFAAACREVGVHWSCGETAELNGLVTPDNVILDGANWGIVPQGYCPALPSRIKASDLIVIIKSNGIHANGLTGAREVGETIGYDYQMDDGRTFAEHLLDATILLSTALEACIDAGIDIHHGISITGGGLIRFLRQGGDFGYILEKLAEPQQVFDIIQRHHKASLREMLESSNYGNGYAWIVPHHVADQMVEIFAAHGHEAWVAGEVVASDHRYVTATQHNLTWPA